MTVRPSSPPGAAATLPQGDATGAGGAAGANPGRVDQSQMRAANLALLLKHLRQHGGRSRARLSTETGLSKGTTSTLIADLAERGLVREEGPDRDGSVGRPGLTVQLDGRAVVGIGLEINGDHIALTAVDLEGTSIRESVTPLDVTHLPLPVILDQIATTLERALTSLRTQGARVVGTTVSPPGVIDYDTGSVRFAPNLGWRDVPLAQELTTRLGPDIPVIHLENDAKLAAIAEFARYAPGGVTDLLYLSGDIGVGAGIITEGRLTRGWSGFSGEVGHLPLDPAGRACKCGRSGCWEQCIGLGEFLRLATPPGDEAQNPLRSLDFRLTSLHKRALAGDELTLAALHTIADNLQRGLSILVDVLNPRVVVLGGYFAYFGDFLLAEVASGLESRRMDQGSSVELATSSLGLLATARGGALMALEAVFDDPTVVPSGA